MTAPSRLPPRGTQPLPVAEPLLGVPPAFRETAPTPAPLLPPPEFMAEREVDEEGFTRWFGSVSDQYALDPDPNADANRGIQYRQMYAMGLEPDAVPGEAMRLLQLEADAPAPEPAEVIAQARQDIVGLYADPRFGRMSQEERIDILGRYPGYEGLSPDEEAYMQRAAYKKLDAGATRPGVEKSKIPFEFLEPGAPMFEEDWAGPTLRAAVESEKQAARANYSAFINTALMPLDLGAQGLELLGNVLLPVGRQLGNLQEWSKEHIQRDTAWMEAKHRREQRSPITILEDVAELNRANGISGADAEAVKQIRKFSGDIRAWADAQEPWAGPLSDSTVGEGLVYLNQGVGSMMAMLPQIWGGSALLGGTGRYFVTTGALEGSAEGWSGAFWGGVHGAIVDRLFKWGHKMPTQGSRAVTTGALFSGLAMWEGAPPEDVAAQFFVGLGLGAHGVLKHQKAVRENVAAIVNEAEREQVILEKHFAEAQGDPAKLAKDTFVDPHTGQIGWAFSRHLPTRIEQLTSVNRVAAHVMKNNGEISVRQAYMDLAHSTWSKAGIPKKEQVLLSRLADAQARAWAENHLRSPDEWYLFHSWQSGIEGGGRPGDVVLTSRERAKPRAPKKKAPGRKKERTPEQSELVFSEPPASEPRSSFLPWRQARGEQAKAGLLTKIRRAAGVGAPKFSREKVRENLRRVGETNRKMHLPIPEKMRGGIEPDHLPEGVRFIGDDQIEFTFPKGPNKGKHFVVGGKSPETWTRLMDEYITDPAERDRSFFWYEDTEPTFRRFFGTEDWKPMAVLSYAAQQMKGPVASFADVLTAVTQELGGAPRRKKGGLAGERLTAILTDQIGTMGAKLHDFADSLDRKSRRTFWLDHELGGKPFVSDVWTLRDAGFLDGNLAFGANSGLRRQLSKEQLGILGKIPVDFKGSPTASTTQYEYTSQWGNRLAKYLNDTKFWGRDDWEPRNAQAVGWVAMQKSTLAKAEYPIDSIVRNSYRVSLEVDSDIAPYSDSYRKLTPHQQGEVTNYALNYALPKIFDAIGYPLRASMRVGTGYWQEYVNQSGWVDIVGSRAQAEAVGRVLGYALGQHEVYVSRVTPGGKTFGLKVVEKSPDGRLAEDAMTTKAIQRLFELDPRVSQGGDRFVESDRRFGFRVLFPEKGETKKETKAIKENNAEVRAEIEADMARIEKGEAPQGKLVKALEQVERELGVELDISGYNAELVRLKNKWADNPGAKNNGYLTGLDKIAGVQGLRRQVVSELAPAIQGEVEYRSRQIRGGAYPGRADLFDKGASEFGVDVARKTIRRIIPSRMRPAKQGDPAPTNVEGDWQPDPGGGLLAQKKGRALNMLDEKRRSPAARVLHSREVEREPIKLSKRQQRMAELIKDSGAQEDLIRDLYSNEPEAALADNLGYSTVKPRDIDNLRQHFYEQAQERMQKLHVKGPFRVWRGGGMHDGDVTMVTTDKSVARFHAERRPGATGEVESFVIEPRDVIGIQDTHGTYAESALIVPRDALKTSLESREGTPAAQAVREQADKHIKFLENEISREESKSRPNQKKLTNLKSHLTDARAKETRVLESSAGVPADVQSFASRVQRIWSEGGATDTESLAKKMKLTPEEARALLGQAGRHDLVDYDIKEDGTRVWRPVEGDDGGGRVLGQIEFPASQISVATPALIRLFEGAHLGTAVHEMGHLLRVTMTPADIATAERFYGVKNGNWETEQEERFAQGFERFLTSGEISDPQLGPVFSKFSNMLRNVYKKAAPHMLDQGILNERTKAQYERWLSPEKARNSNPAAIGREWAAPMTLAELEWQQQRRPLIDAERTFEAFQGADPRTEMERYADNLNLTKVRNAADVTAGLKAMADVVGETSTPRIKTETWREAAQFAEEQGITLKEYLRRNDGRLPDQKELTAARAFLYASTREVQHLARIAKETRAPADLVAFERSAMLNKMIRDKLSGEITKIARAFGSLRMIMDVPTGDPQRNSLIDMAVESGGGVERMLDAATRVADIENEGGAVPRQIDAELKGSLRGAVLELWIMGLLSGFKTQARNLLSNTAMTGMASPEAFMAASIGTARTRTGQAAKFLMGDRAPKWFTNQDRVYYGESVARTYGWLSGGWTGLRLAAKVVASDGIWNPLSRAERTKNIPAVGKAVEAAQRALEAGKSIEIDPRLETVEARQSKLAELRRGQIAREAFGLDPHSENPASKMAGAFIDQAGAIVRSPGVALEAGDAIFRSIGFSQEMHARAWRQAAKENPSAARILDKEFRLRVAELTANPTKEMLDAAELNAGYMTFTNPLGPLGKMLMKGRSEAPALRLLLPFMVAPTNIVTRQFERTPVALASKRVRKEIKTGGAQGDTALARLTMGSMIMGVFAHMAANGLITGDGPSDRSLRAGWLDVYQPRSFFWGNPDTGMGQWISYDFVEPYSSLMAVGADVGDTDAGKIALAETVAPIASMLGFTAKYAEIAGELEPETAGELVEVGIQAIVKNFTSKTWWRSITELANVVYDTERHFDRWRNAYVRSAVPRVMAQKAQYDDPVWREAHTMLDTLRSQIPGYSQKLPARRNAWGDPLTFGGGLGPDMVSPIYTRDAASNPLYKECVRLEIPIRKPHKKIGGVELSQQEYDWLVTSAGPLAKKYLLDVVTEKMAANPRAAGEFKDPEMRVPGHSFNLTRDKNLMWGEMTDLEQKSVIYGTLRKVYGEYKKILHGMILEQDPERVTDPILKELQRSGNQLRRRGLESNEDGGFHP